MKLERVCREVYCRPWLVKESTHAAIRKIIESKLAGAPVEFEPLEPEDDATNIVDGVAVIPVRGVMLKGASVIEKMCGAVNPDEISAEVQAAVADPNVHAIFLDVDSPGGSVGGIAELADVIAEANAVKPVLAFADGMMCSAAYWVSAGAGMVYGSASSEVGSIGVYMPWLDETVRYAAAGVKVDLIRNADSPLKGAGYPGTALTEAQRQNLQEQVDDIAADFKGFILNHRVVKDSAMQGQAVIGKRAKDAGLIDEVTTRDKAMADLKLAVTMRGK